MSRIRITKTFTFEMAHALFQYDGPCAHIHGHSYHLAVTLRGRPLSDPNHPKSGMVMDFSFVKALVQNTILDQFDHVLVLNQTDPRAQYFFNNDTKLIVVPYQPTCENLVADFAERMKPKLPDTVELFSLQLRETPTGFAEWYADDN